MYNQPRKISGYRDLSEAEIDLMNRIKAKAAEVGALVEEVQSAFVGQRCNVAEAMAGSPTYDEVAQAVRAAAIAKTELQTGFMWLVRAVARPGGF